MSEVVDKVDKPAVEWRELLSERSFAVLFKEATEPPGTSDLNHEKRAGHVRLRRVPPAALRVDGQVRERDRLAQLLRRHSGPAGHEDRLQADPAAHGVSLRALRRPPGARLQGRPAADRPALLQQRRRAAVRARRRGAAAAPRVMTATPGGEGATARPRPGGGRASPPGAASRSPSGWPWPSGLSGPVRGAARADRPRQPRQPPAALRVRSSCSATPR